MNDDAPVYLNSINYDAFVARAKSDRAFAVMQGIKPCPLTGEVEEYTVMDRLGGDLNMWPAWARQTIEHANALSVTGTAFRG